MYIQEESKWGAWSTTLVKLGGDTTPLPVNDVENVN